MSESVLQRMKRLLNATGSYKLTGSTSADWEGKACAAGLEAVEEAVEQLLADLSPSSASPERLESWEKLFQPQLGTGTDGDRRQIARQRLAMTPGCFTPESLSPLLAAAGVAGDGVEGENGLTIVVGKRLGLTEEECRRELELILPAHLNWTWVEEMNWAALDAWSAPFETLDGLGRTWEDWDALTKTQLETEEN